MPSIYLVINILGYYLLHLTERISKFTKDLNLTKKKLITQYFKKVEVLTVYAIFVKTMLLLKRNRKNTSVIANKLLIQSVITIIGVFVAFTNR